MKNTDEVWRQAFRQTYNKEPTFLEMSQFRKNAPYTVIRGDNDRDEDEEPQLKSKAHPRGRKKRPDAWIFGRKVGDNFTLSEGINEV